MELNKVSHSAKNINDAYLRAISNKEVSDEAIQLYEVVNSDLNRGIKTSWVSVYIAERAKYVATQTGVNFQDVLILVKEQFIVNFLNNLDKDASFIKRTVRYSADYVQSVLFSDMAKDKEAREGLSFINEDQTKATVVTITIDASKRRLAESLATTQVVRKDQRKFILSLLNSGKEATMKEYGYTEKRFNERLAKALDVIAKYQSKNADDYLYLKSFVNEIIETDAYDAQEAMSEDEQLQELWDLETRV